jgi:hypothetical protein
MPEYVLVADVLTSMADAMKQDADDQLADLEEMLELCDVEETEPIGLRPGTFGMLGKAGYLSMYSGIARKSWSAGRLEAALQNAQASGGTLNWYEFAQTGHPRLDRNVAKIAQVALQALSKEFEFARAAHLSGASTPLKPEWNKAEGSDTVSMLRVIGFEKTELVNFLNYHDLPHCFTETSRDSTKSHAVIDTQVNGEIPSHVESIDWEDVEIFKPTSLPQSTPPIQITTRIHKSGNLRITKPAELQKKIVEEVIREFLWKDPILIRNEVWGRLKEIAKKPDSDRPDFLKQYKKGPRIEYDGQGFNGCDRKTLRQNIERWLEKPD